jgi:hypothetical protein
MGLAGVAATADGGAATVAKGAGSGAAGEGEDAGAGFLPNSQSQIRWKTPRFCEVTEIFTWGIRGAGSTLVCMVEASGRWGLLTGGVGAAFGVLLSLTLESFFFFESSS